MKSQLLYKSTSYTLIGGVLYKKRRDEVLRRCIFQSEVDVTLEGCHLDSCGGHFAGDNTAWKALMAGYWWPTMFSNAHQFVRRCNPCQQIGCSTGTFAMPLVQILAQAPFEKWDIDFVGPNAPPSQNGLKRYILVATNYVIKWAEVVRAQFNKRCKETIRARKSRIIF